MKTDVVPVKKITCIGSGYVGGPTMTYLASQWPEIQVTVVDIDSQKIQAWNSDQLPVYEPGLKDLVQAHRGKNLFFSTDIDQAIEEGEIIFISVNTPTKTYGLGQNKASDLGFIQSCARHIARVAKGNKIIVEKSTVPVRTAEILSEVLHACDNEHSFDILSSPEFLAEGTAIHNLAYPDRVLIGHVAGPNGEKAAKVLSAIYLRWVPQEKILTTGIWSSELSKLASNAFLAQRISSINALSALCEKTEASVDEIARAVGSDSRIGYQFLKSSVGFGGSCFRKDLLNLIYLCEHFALPEVARYWEQVLEINEWQKKRFAQFIVKAMFNSLYGQKIAIWGFAFKKNTNDVRDTPALTVCKYLLAEKAQLSIYDPLVEKEKIQELLGPEVEIVSNAHKASKGASAIVILTEYDEFKTCDYAQLLSQMQRPAFLFDGRNIVDLNKLKTLGFRAYGIGKNEK